MKSKGLKANKPQAVHGEERGLDSASYSYLKHLRLKGLAETTIRSYRQSLRDYERFLAEAGVDGVLAATAGTLRDFQVWLSEEEKRRGGKLSAGYIRIRVAVLRGMYRWLQQESAIYADPTKGLVYPKLPKRLHREVLTEEEVRGLVGSPGDSPAGLRDKVALRLLVLSGLRTAELAAANVGDISLPDRELVVREGKGSKDRLVFFDVGTRALLARYLMQSRPKLVRDKGEAALIVTDLGRRMCENRLRELVKVHAKSAGLPPALCPMTLRHSFCTNLLRHGVNLKALAELAGHASLNTTAGYTRVDIAELSAVYQAAHPRSGGCT